jgi:hypothetical protein
MSKIGRRRKQNTRPREIHNARQRHELEWLLYEQREKSLESLRTPLVFAWLFLCFLGAFFIGDQDGVLIWAGSSAIALILVYQLRGLWLTRQAEKQTGTTPDDGG